MSKLVIVESPAKAATIQKYLGSGYEVVASMGHVRDLPKSKLGVDVDHDFAPVYENIKGKEDLIKKLKAAAKKSDTILLATDPGRGGDLLASGRAPRGGCHQGQPHYFYRDHQKRSKERH